MGGDVRTRQDVLKEPTTLDHIAVERAVSIGDACLRNHEVTLGYWELGRQLAKVVGDESANWCTWATWASRTVGHALDVHEEPFLVDARTRKWPKSARRAALGLAHFSRTTLNPAMATALAVGNREIYDEIADHFVDFLDALEQHRLSGIDDAREWALQLVPAATTDHEISRRFEHHRAAFVLYYRASVERDAVRRSQLVLAANLLITDYEQRRLQQYVEVAFFTAPKGWRSLRESACALFGKRIARITTKRVTAVITPRYAIPVGEPLALLPGARVLYPIEFDEPIPELREVLGRYAPGTIPQCSNWADFDDRMRYITGLFTAYHFDESLDEDPFTELACKELHVALTNPKVNPTDAINNATRLERLVARFNSQGR